MRETCRNLAGGLDDSESEMALSHAAEVFSSRLFHGTGNQVSGTDHHPNGIQRTVKMSVWSTG